MTPFSFVGLIKKERMLFLARILLYGGPVERQFMQYEHHPLKESTYHQLEASAPKQRDIFASGSGGGVRPSEFPIHQGTRSEIMS